MTRALVVLHTAQEGPGFLGDDLTAAGVELTLLRPYAGEPVPGRVEADALVVLGGPMGAYDDDVAPWLPATRDLLAAAVAHGVPTLGICLGAQLLAVAAGGRVERGIGGPEIGVCPLELGAAAADDPLLAGVPSPAPVMQWHYDAVVQLPEGAVPLARSGAYEHQAFRLGSAWGLQFHPEVGRELAGAWAAADAAELGRLGLDPAAVVAGAADREPELRRVWGPMAGRFAAL